MPLNTISDLFGPSTQEQMGRIVGLSSTYDDWLERDQGDGHTRAPGIHASEVSGCERKIVYSILGTKRTQGHISAIWRKRFAMGHAVHQMLQRNFHQMARESNGLLTFQDEIVISPRTSQMAAKWEIYSSCDGVFGFKDTADGLTVAQLGLEIKTMNPSEFEKLQKPKPEHIEQAHVYMACLDIPIMWFLYWDKGHQNTTGTNNPNFLVKFNPKVWTELEARFDRVHTLAALNQLPERQESLICEFCAFADTCQPTQWKRTHRSTTPHTKWSQR